MGRTEGVLLKMPEMEIRLVNHRTTGTPARWWLRRRPRPPAMRTSSNTFSGDGTQMGTGVYFTSMPDR